MSEKNDRIRLSPARSVLLAAIYAGLIYAKGDYVGLMDVDLQDPPKFLGEMYRTLETGEYDCVAARAMTFVRTCT